MKGKKAGLLATAVLMTVFAGGSHPAMAAGDSTTVQITGTVQDNTCTLTGAGETLTFKLNPVSVRDFGGSANITVGAVDIPITFSDCGSGTTGVTVKVSGTVAGNNGAFKNTLDGQPGGATNVGVYFYDTDGTTLIAAGEDVGANKQQFTSGTTLHYKASYVSLDQDVKAGQLNTAIKLIFTYI